MQIEIKWWGNGVISWKANISEGFSFFFIFFWGAIRAIMLHAGHNNDIPLLWQLVLSHWLWWPMSVLAVGGFFWHRIKTHPKLCSCLNCVWRCLSGKGHRGHCHHCPTIRFHPIQAYGLAVCTLFLLIASIMCHHDLHTHCKLLLTHQMCVYQSIVLLLVWRSTIQILHWYGEHCQSHHMT